MGRAKLMAFGKVEEVESGKERRSSHFSEMPFPPDFSSSDPYDRLISVRPTAEIRFVTSPSAHIMIGFPIVPVLHPPYRRNLGNFLLQTTWACNLNRQSRWCLCRLGDSTGEGASMREI